MSLLKIEKHSDVLPALSLVQDEVKKEAQRIFSAGGDALKVGKIRPAKEAIAYAEELEAFVEKVKALEADWKALEAKIDEATPEVKEIVLPPKSYKERKPFTRTVTKVAPKTNFTVKFSNGTMVTAPQARLVFAKSIEMIGAKKVAALNLFCCGEPLVTNDKSQIKKEPSQITEISGGWFVKTHSSTSDKMAYVKRISEKLKLNLEVTLVPNAGK